MNIFTSHRRGSALITTLLVTALIMLTAVGIAQLITGDIRTGGEFVQDGKALYMAEGGLERGLLTLKDQLPGYQPKLVKGGVDKENLSYETNFKTQSNDIPHIEPGMVSVLNKADAYNTLSAQHSVAVPLFTVDDAGVAHKIHDFLVKYYVPFDLSKNIAESQLQDIDFFRWKIVGIAPDTKKAESVSDFTSASDFAIAEKPNCFGTSKEKVQEKFSDVIPDCIPDMVKSSSDVQNCQYNQARSYYKYTVKTSYDGFEDSAPIEVLDTPCYAIADFLANHDQNYLILTNLVNPDIIQALSPDAQSALSYIKYRVVTTEPVLRDKVTIESTGNSGGILGGVGAALLGGSTKKLDLQLSGEAFLPVFNFSIYQTDLKKK